jgi:fucose permease
VPQVYARLKDVMSPQSAFFWSMLPCYLYILYYSMRGYRVGRREVSPLTAPAAAD